MKYSINKSAKRVLSLALAVVMLVGTLFVANIGTGITADAATDPKVEKTVLYWDGSNGAFPTNGTGTKTDPFIIETPAQLHYVATAAGTGSTTEKYFKVADNMIFVLQPQTVISDLDAFKAKSASEVKAFFASVEGEKNWIMSTNCATFNGFFDGNGVEIYGLFADARTIIDVWGVAKDAGSESAALFPNVDGGKGKVSADITYNGTVYKGTINDTDPMFIKNMTVANSYIMGVRRAGVIFGTSQWGPGGAIVDGIISLDGLVVANNFVEGVGRFQTAVGSTVEKWNSSGEMGVLCGSSGNDPATITNCLVYGNQTLFTKQDGTTNTFCLTGGTSGNRPYSTKEAVSGGVKNSLILGTNVCSSCSNSSVTSGLFAEESTATGYVKVTADAVKGLKGASRLGAFNWAKKDTDLTDGNTYWFVRENDLPTPIQPASDYWKTVEILSIWSGAAASGYAGGTGTQEDPYIIKTPEQLYRALTLITDTVHDVVSAGGAITNESVAGGYQSGRIFKQGSTTDYVPVFTPYYYKVADGIDAIYLNDVIGSETKETIHALVANKEARDWRPKQTFVGHLDGNGVTIYGMYTKDGEGLVYELDGSATVANINFDACYTTRAMLTKYLGSYTNDSTLITVNNISVRDCCLHSNASHYIEKSINADASKRVINCVTTGASLISSGSTCENLTISNCLFDGYSCDVTQGKFYFTDNKNTDDKNIKDENGQNIPNPNCDDVITVLTSNSADTNKMVGGIISGGSGMNNTLITACVSLGAPVVDEFYFDVTKAEVNPNVDQSELEIFYNRYDKNQGYPVYFYDSYTDITTEMTTAYPDKYGKLEDFEIVSKKDVYEVYDMPKLGARNWKFITDGARALPVPTVNTAESVGSGSYAVHVAKDNDHGIPSGPYEIGTNPNTQFLPGSGTEADPYLIKTDVQLARAISTGGMNLYDKLYYKLIADIDISTSSWLGQDKVDNGVYLKYVYTPFGGVLDGDGHTITGLSAGGSSSSGLIPVLAKGGVVKNLHLRDANVVSSAYAGAIVGEAHAESVIENCSVEDAYIASKNGTSVIVGNALGSMDDVYYVTDDAEYYKANGVEYNADNCKNIFNDDANKGIWYIGGKEGSKPKLRNFNKATSSALDIVGDGIADGYGAGDLAALRNHLFKKDAYKNINGDVSRNGVINLADLAILQRTIIGDYGSTISDTFFANAEAGQIKIYYGENDNYDAARKLEVYIEKLFPGTDVTKVVSTDKGTVDGANSDSTKVYVHSGDEIGTPDGKLEIIVGYLDNYSAYAKDSANNLAAAANTYAITYDEANKVVWLQGENFTAVEQAVLDFIKESTVDGDVVYTCGATTLADYKQPVTVKIDTNCDGTTDTDKTFYYAWGDEFSEENLNTDNWIHNTQQSESDRGEQSNYHNQEVVPTESLDLLITTTNGTLSMKRGFRQGMSGNTKATKEDGTEVNASTFVAGQVTQNGTVCLEIPADAFNGYKDDDGNPAIDEDDNYFSSGKITTSRSMLFKQGYLEFEGRLPADGHAFPAWWLMGRDAISSRSNTAYSNSLYGKVYKINDDWNGTNDQVANKLNTYKYQIPTAIYEIDMIEVMQAASVITSSYYMKRQTTAVGYYVLNTTIHKWWDNGVVSGNDSNSKTDDFLYIRDWDKYTVSDAISFSDFKTTSESNWIHNPGSTAYKFDQRTSANYSSVHAASREYLEKHRKYGFSWTVSDDNTKFEATLYIYDTDGKTIITTLPIATNATIGPMKVGKSETDTSLSSTLETSGIIGTVNGGAYKDVWSDAKVANQYMYILIDDKFYSSNDHHTTPGTMFTDLLTAAGLTSFELDYMRVYQQDDRRDIVTKETQEFNNNNHFGY